MCTVYSQHSGCSVKHDLEEGRIERHGQSSHGYQIDLERKVTIGRDPRPWIHFKTEQFFRAWWHMLLILALKRQRHGSL